MSAMPRIDLVRAIVAARGDDADAVGVDVVVVAARVVGVVAVGGVVAAGWCSPSS